MGSIYPKLLLQHLSFVLLLQDISCMRGTFKGRLISEFFGDHYLCSLKPQGGYYKYVLILGISVKYLEFGVMNLGYVISVPLYRQNKGFWSIIKVLVIMYNVQSVNPLSKRISNPFSTSITFKRFVHIAFDCKRH